jgi:hypothetical protein
MSVMGSVSSLTSRTSALRRPWRLARRATWPKITMPVKKSGAQVRTDVTPVTAALSATAG